MTSYTEASGAVSTPLVQCISDRRSTYQCSLHRRKLLQVVGTPLRHCARRLGEVMSVSCATTVSGALARLCSAYSQRFPQCSRVPGRTKLVHELQDTLDIGIDLEDLERERGLQGDECGLLWGLRNSTRRQRALSKSGFYVLETHVGRRG